MYFLKSSTLVAFTAVDGSRVETLHQLLRAERLTAWSALFWFVVNELFSWFPPFSDTITYKLGAVSIVVFPFAAPPLRAYLEALAVDFLSTRVNVRSSQHKDSVQTLAGRVQPACCLVFTRFR
jgi:hypothetical protein